MDVSSNLLECVIFETHFANLFNLKELRLSQNSLSFNINNNWIPPFQLDVIGLGNCGIGPSFPKWLQTQKDFSTLDISSAGISDIIPTWFCDVSPKLHYLNLSHNQIGRMVPDLSKSSSEYSIIDLGYNCFEGIIPLVPQSVWWLNLSNNRFKGSMSLCSLGNKSFLKFLNLSSNMLSGELPDCWMHLKNLYFLSLANNSFSEKIPNSIGFMNHINFLSLRNNSFKGELSSSLKNRGRLRVFDASGNKLSGNRPVWVETHLSSLVLLSFQKNEFYGSIPSQLCQLNQIQVLDLSQNNLLGNIPQCFNNFTALAKNKSSNGGTFEFQVLLINDNSIDFLVSVANAFVHWKRQELEYTKTLELLKTIDLLDNKLASEIPQEIVSLVGLISLNLSRNKLMGNIMQKIGDMEMLESLNLSKNYLSGEIPTSFAHLHYLGVLDVSSNNLFGQIPTSTQLQSFDVSTYTGNANFCGLLLPKCSRDETDGHEKNNNKEEDDDGLWTSEFYMSMGIGFFVGFSTIFGSMLFKDS